MAMPADGHFATFVADSMETHEFDVDGAQAVCKKRVNNLRGDLEAVKKSVEVYLRRHFRNITPYSFKVCELILEAINGPEGRHGGARDAGGCALPETPVRCPPLGHRPTHDHASFTRLRELVDEGARTSLVKRNEFWRLAPDKAAGSSGGKMEGAPGPGGQRTAPAPGRVGGPRAVVWTGGGRHNPHLSPHNEYGLGHHDRRARVHYQLAHHENLVPACKGRHE